MDVRAALAVGAGKPLQMETVQLEKAVDVALKLLQENEVDLKPQPPDPVRVRRSE